MSNRRWWAVAAGVLALVSPATMAGSAPSAGGLASDNVTYITTIPLDGGATGARIVGDYLYVAGARGFSIYDVSDPVAPKFLSTTVTGVQFPNEDVDTNGRILLVSDEQVGGSMQVWDVEDKASPAKLAELSGVRDHTLTCVLDCKWAYGARGTILDLRDPADPQIAGHWAGVAPGFGFDTTEVGRGRVLTASRLIYFLDARNDPARPKVLATGSTTDNRLIHSLRWPNDGRDRFFLVQGETPLSRRCNEDSGAFMTWDAARWKQTRTFRMIDEFRVANGTFVDGSPPANTTGCTVMWFQEHPRFRNGGLVAAAFFDHGTRFLRVGKTGKIDEVGYFLPFGGQPIAAYWRNAEIVYSIDTARGIDVLRFDGS